MDFIMVLQKESIDKIIHNNEMLLIEMDVKGALSIKSYTPIKLSQFLFLLPVLSI